MASQASIRWRLGTIAAILIALGTAAAFLMKAPTVREVTAPVSPQPLMASSTPQSSVALSVDPTVSSASATGDAPKPTTPSSALTFDRAQDLYKLATQSIDASDPLVLYNGWQATQACMSVLKARSQYEQLAAADSTPKSSAAKALLQRCAGFFNNDLAANSGLLKRFGDKLANDNTHYFGGLSTGDMTQQNVDAMLGARDWATFVAMQYQVMPGVAAALGIAPGSAEEAYLGIAWLQASCDLGKDCSGQSVMYIARCADSGKCPGSIEAEYAEGLSAQQKAEIQKYRAKIVQAFLSQDKLVFKIVPPS